MKSKPVTHSSLIWSYHPFDPQRAPHDRKPIDCRLIPFDWLAPTPRLRPFDQMRSYGQPG